jgi:hypothetical protein
MGLGPPTVVRLEGALAHEVLRYCTAIWVSVLKVVRGTGRDESTGATGPYFPAAFETLIGHNRKPATTKYLGERTGRRKRPSTQACSNVREPAGHGQTHAVLPCHWASESVENRLWWSGGAIPVRRYAD